MTQRAERLHAVHQLLANHREGVLSTLSVRHGGWPFGSVTPYALSDRGEPVLLLSELAEHTRNLRADPRASLFVQAQGAVDSQAAPRATLLGTVHSAADDALRERYLAWHPSATAYFQMQDFSLYVLTVEHVRYVAGFGDMGWLSAPFD